ncbi:MAG: sigma-70 family RNA polymerase sigma factor [Planctomycetes bacterium]|nr:sigma-70 family RNA polymerase sigma factor [Planctomycetota bacterium]NUQ35262.1 sigma-70 family RNA polymerase sigma factor [Planctomycetaceae bacterium]
MTFKPPLAGAHSNNGKRARFEREALPLFDGLYASAMALTRNRADAEDLTQETLLKAWKNFDSYESGTNLRGWLYRIMMNAYITSYRKKRRAPGRADPEMLNDVADPGSQEQFERERAAWVELGDKLALKDFQERLDGRLSAAIDSLPDEYREVLLLSAINDLSYKEIAEAAGIPVGTVMSRLSRAKAAVRDRLSAESSPEVRVIE